MGVVSGKTSENGTFFDNHQNAYHYNRLVLGFSADKDVFILKFSHL